MGEEETDNRRPTGDGWACRCLVLVDRLASTPPPARLLAGLEKRGAAIRTAGDAAEVMVGLHEFQPHVLIVCNPHDVRAGASLLQAVTACYPKVVVWRYDPPVNGHQEWLTPLAASPPASAARSEPARFTMEPRLQEPRTTPTRPSAGTAMPQGMQHVVSALTGDDDIVRPPEISAEELAMLLGPSWGHDEPTAAEGSR